MSNLKHQIQRQVLEAEGFGLHESYGFQERIKAVYYNQLLPKMEQLFNGYADENHLIRLEKLEIELLLSDKNWENELVGQAINQLDLRLRESKVQIIASTPNENLRIDAMPSISETEIFCFFLETGSLPWFARISLAQLESKITKFLQSAGAGLETQQAGFLFKIKLILFGTDASIERLVLQFNEGLLLALFGQEKSYQLLKAWLPKAIDFYADKRSISKGFAFWKAVIKASLIPSTEKEGGKDVVKLFLKELTPEELTLLQQLLSGEKQQELTEILKGQKIDFTCEKTTEILYKKETKKNPRFNQEEFYVENAGLVLLQSFFIPFWEAVGLWKEDNFTGHLAHQRAVLLTQFMVFPEEEMPEFDLLLNKILCGFPVGDTLPVNLEINPSEEKEMDEMFEHINQHWKMNGTPVNTSAENLRAAFLQRPGKLSRKEKGWLLQVGQRPYDLVLGSFPWGFGIIKNKLMEEILWVEWA